MYIENINGPEDVKKLSEDQLNVLAEEIRDALLKKIKQAWRSFWTEFRYGRSNDRHALCI